MYHAWAFIPGWNCPSINMVENDTDPNYKSSIQRVSHLDISTKYQHLTNITIVITTSRFFGLPLLILIIDDTCNHLCTRPTLVHHTSLHLGVGQTSKHGAHATWHFLAQTQHGAYICLCGTKSIKSSLKVYLSHVDPMAIPRVKSCYPTNTQKKEFQLNYLKGMSILAIIKFCSANFRFLGTLRASPPM